MPAQVGFDSPSLVIPQSDVGSPVPENRVQEVALPTFFIDLEPLHIPKMMPPVQIAEDKSNEKIFLIFVVALSCICAGFCLFSLIPAGIALVRLLALARRPTQVDLNRQRYEALEQMRDSLCNQHWKRKIVGKAGGEIIQQELASLRVAIGKVEREMLSAGLSLHCEIQREALMG